MAARSREHDPSDAPSGDGRRSWLTRWAKVGFGLTARATASAEGHRLLDLTRTRAAMQDGLLMVFGPDGDPIPPRAFAAAAAERPEGRVGLAGGERVPASRVAAVLEAQSRGRLGSGHGADQAWVRTMLGLESQPEAATAAELAAEDRPFELTVFGADLMISLPAGRSFLVAEARTPASSCARLCGPEGEPVTIGDLVTRLRAHIGGDGGGDDRASAEIRLAGCVARIENDALILDLTGLGALHLCPVQDPAAPASLISVFLASGEAATMDDLLHALDPPAGDPAEAPAVVADADESRGDVGQTQDPAGPPEGERSTRGHARMSTRHEATAPADAPAGRPIGLAIALPGDHAASIDDVAMVVVTGLGNGSLSAGIDNGDGSWSLPPQDLIGLSLTPPPTGATGLVLQIRAITVKNRDGELASASKTIRVPVAAADGAPGEVGIPVVVDPDLLRRGDRVDAIMVRDLPAGTGLSVGTYDPSIDAWVLLPSQLGALVVTPAGEQAEDFLLWLTGISLKPAGPPRVLARIPIAVR